MKRGLSPREETGLLIGLAIVAVIIQCLPAIGEALQWQRSAALPVTALTTLTGHFTHWSWDHLIWDVAAFVGLGFAAIRVNPGRLGTCIAIASISIPIEIALFHPQFETYRGLSGIDSALFGLLLAGLWRQGKAARILSVLGFLGFFGKTIFELMTGDTIFVERTANDFIPATSAHLVGLVVGIFTSRKPSALTPRLESPSSPENEISKFQIVTGDV